MYHSSPLLAQSTEEQLDMQVNTDEYDIIDMRSGPPQPKEVIDLSVIDESESSENKYVVIRLTKRFISMIACLLISIFIMLIAIVVSVHYIFHL